MEKMMKKLMMAGIACVALCGTTLAAPAHKPAQGRAPAPVVQKAQRPAPAPLAAHKPAPAPHKAPAHHMPPPPPPRCCRHNRHECHDCHHNVGGATLLGAIVGGIIGAIAS